jgi:hypothetical protein
MAERISCISCYSDIWLDLFCGMIFHMIFKILDRMQDI